MSSFHALRFLSCLALAVPLLAAAEQVTVSATGTATLGSLSYRTWDIDPADGITPAYAFNIDPDARGGYSSNAGPAGTTLTVNVLHSYNGSASPGESAGVPGAVFAPLQLNSSDSGPSTASASSSASGLQAQATAAHIYTESTPWDQYYQSTYPHERASSSALADASGLGTSPLGEVLVGYLEVSPHTVIEITGLAQVTGAASLDVDCAGCAFLGGAYLDAGVELGLSWFADPRTNGQTAAGSYSSLGRSAQFSNQEWGTPPPALDAFDDSAELRATYANTTDQVQKVQFWAITRVSTQAYGAALGVAPEPSTYALVGLGLGAAGWIARRRRAG